MWCERVMVVWHLLFLGSVSRGASGTKEKSKSKGHEKGGWGRRPGRRTRAREKKQGAEHKASQIDLSLHQESHAKLLHYHTHHTLLDDRVPATYQVPAALHLHN